MLALLLAVSTGLAPAEQSPPTVQAAAVVPRQLALARQLATTLNSEKLARAQLSKVLDNSIPKLLASSPEFVAMEAQYPGIMADAGKAAKSVLVADALTRMPALWDQIATIYARQMTEHELRAVVAFYQSPIGARVHEIIVTNADMAPMLNEAMANDSFQVKAESLRPAFAAGMRAVERELPPADLVQAKQFWRSPAGQKMSLLAPQVRAIAGSWTNKPTPEVEQKVETAVNAVIDARTGGGAR